MTAVYLLTNLDRKAGEKRFYIGSKAECRLEVLNGLPTLIDCKTEKPYLGSSSSPEMKQDLLLGHRFSATILKSKLPKKRLLEAENECIKEFNAVDSPEYYNMAYATLGGFMHDHNAVMNFFGETIKEYSSSKSGTSKRNTTAKKLGFDCIGDLALYIYEERALCNSYKEVADKLNCDRHTPSRFIEGYDMPKCFKEVQDKNEDTQHLVRDLYTRGASYHKIKELTGLEIPTITIYLKGFDRGSTKEYLTARRRNLTEEELQLKIIALYLSGESIGSCADKLNINKFSAVRYFDKYVRAHLPNPLDQK